jgi:hypothetical protein
MRQKKQIGKRYNREAVEHTENEIGQPGDYRCEERQDGKFIMRPSGDVVTAAERDRRFREW